MLSHFIKKPVEKHNVVARMTSSSKFKQRKLLSKKFTTPHFSYPVIWMFHCIKLNNWIDHIHERGLKLVYKDYNSFFDEFKDDFFRINHRKLQKLGIEIFKVEVGIAPEIMKNGFAIIENPYDLRNETKFKSRNDHTL